MIREADSAKRARRLRSAVLIGVSVVLLTGTIVVTVVLGVGVRTTYGSGIDSALGGQVVRDFLADQDAEALALSKADESQLTNRLSDSALSDVVQQIHEISRSGAPPSISFQPSSINVLRALDPSDPSLVTEVQEDGVKTVTSKSSPDAVPSQQAIAFHGDFWLRNLSGRYTIADQNIQAQPTSFARQIALLATALIWVGLAGLLIRRTRTRPRREGPIAPTASFQPSLEAPLLNAAEEELQPPANVVIRTFGGLQVVQDGKDWASSLNARPVMGFVWRRVLVAAIADRHSPLTRDELSRQASPGVDRETQLKRLRNLLHQGLRELPDGLRVRLVVEPQSLRFNLTDCQIDAIELLDANAEGAGRSLLTPAQAARAQHALDTSAGVFLPEFETVEDIATDHHPTCTELIRDLRIKLSTKRLSLATVLADTYLEANRVDQAIAILESIRQDHPTRTDLRDRLATAYRHAGREAEARGLTDRSC